MQRVYNWFCVTGKFKVNVTESTIGPEINRGNGIMEARSHIIHKIKYKHKRKGNTLTPFAWTKKESEFIDKSVRANEFQEEYLQNVPNYRCKCFKELTHLIFTLTLEWEISNRESLYSIANTFTPFSLKFWHFIDFK